jgi:2-amino-4-hydroxy-6-hydroxymethyldihydropteridine diphosphokinase
MKKAAKLLRETWPEITFSSVFTSAPRHVTDQPDFLNAVAVFASTESPQAIRSILNAIEKELKKEIAERFGPRTIDLDLLLYGDDVIDEEHLTVPHPRMHERRFVLEPLKEILHSTVHIPGRSTLEQHLKEVQDQECRKTALHL